MTVERLVLSRSARSSRAAINVSSRRTGTTRAGPSPLGLRPRLRNVSTSYPRSASSAHAWTISGVTRLPLMVSIGKLEYEMHRASGGRAHAMIVTLTATSGTGEVTDRFTITR